MGTRLTAIQPPEHRWRIGDRVFVCQKDTCARSGAEQYFGKAAWKGALEAMKSRYAGTMFHWFGVLCAVVLLAKPVLPAIKNLAVITSAGSKLSDLPLAELEKYCKGASKTWPDGRNFTLVMKDPSSPEMHVAVTRLFGATPAEVKASIAKLNETRQALKIVNDDEELLRTVQSTPGALGIVDVYSINSGVKVLRIDGKLPFDVGYAFKGN